MKPIDNSNPLHREILITTLEERFNLLKEKRKHKEIEEAFAELYQAGNVQSMFKQLISKIDKNTAKTKDVKRLIENFEKLKQEKTTIKMVSIKDCLSILHVNTLTSLLKATTQDEMLKTLQEKITTSARFLTKREQDWQEKLKTLEENDKQSLSFFQRNRIRLWQSITKTWTHFIKPIGLSLYQETPLSQFGEMLRFLGKSLEKSLARHLPAKKNRNKKTSDFTLKTIGTGIGFCFMYFMTNYFILRMIVAETILTKLNTGINRHNYIKRNILMISINTGLFSAEALYFGEFYLASTLSTLLGSMTILTATQYLKPDLLPAPEKATRETKTKLRTVSLFSFLLGALLTKKGIEMGILFPRFYRREQVKAFLHAGEKQGMIKELQIHMPPILTDPDLWLSDKNPMILMWLYKKDVITAVCEIASNTVECLSVPPLLTKPSFFH